LLADRDPEEARQLLDPVLERLMAAVQRYEGTVNQVMGDGIMALFGAPIAHEDHAIRACYAALAMQVSVQQYATEVQRTRGVPIHIRVGLNSGEVVVRAIGNDLHMDYTAVGQTTYLAARVEQMAMPGSILITGETLRQAMGYVAVKSLDLVPVKGLHHPVEAFELQGAGPARTRMQAVAMRERTYFVGREAEREVLRQALSQAQHGRGQVVAVVGEPGVGKSRLIHEFTHAPEIQGWLILESHTLSYSQAVPYLPVRDLLKAYVQLQDGEAPQRIRERLTGQLLRLEDALRPALLPLLALLDMPVEDPAWQALDPLQRRQRMLDAVKRLLLRESQRQLLLLVVEDLHWVDAETEALLDMLVESLPSARLLLLVSGRPEYQPRWGRKTYYTQLRLDPLPAASAAEVLHALLGDDPGLAPLKRLLLTRTEGNPFFLEESVRTLVETGVLVGGSGVARLVKPLDSLQVPATVQAVLASRIDRLPAEDKRLLQTAAVIGAEVPLPLLQAIADLSEAALRRGLAHLQATEFLYETHLFPEHKYTFQHTLTHEVAYGSLLQERRRTLHARIVEVLETRYADRVAEQVERLARHAVRGEVWAKVVTYCWQAGDKARHRGAVGEAAAGYEQALHALGYLPETPDIGVFALELRHRLAGVLSVRGEYPRSLALLGEAEARARQLDDGARLGWVLVMMASLRFTQGT
jgi:predicted ATPase/class 3 adenylate cyclase